MPVAYFFSDLDNQEPGSTGSVSARDNAAEEMRQELVLELTTKLGRLAAKLKDLETRGAIKSLLRALPDAAAKSKK